METINLNNELYFLIGNRGATVGSETFVTCAMRTPIKVDDIVLVESIQAVVTGIEEERPSKAKGKIFQKLNVTIEKNTR